MKQPTLRILRRNENIRKYKEKGLSLRKIGAMFHISYETVRLILKQPARSPRMQIEGSSASEGSKS